MDLLPEYYNTGIRDNTTDYLCIYLFILNKMAQQVSGILQVDVNPPPDAPPIVVKEQGAGEPPVIWNFNTHSTWAYYKS